MSSTTPPTETPTAMLVAWLTVMPLVCEEGRGVKIAAGENVEVEGWLVKYRKEVWVVVVGAGVAELIREGVALTKRLRSLDCQATTMGVANAYHQIPDKDSVLLALMITGVPVAAEVPQSVVFVPEVYPPEVLGGLIVTSPPCPLRRSESP